MDIHIANVDFEFELSSSHSVPLQQGLERHPLFLQLQFMPLLYAHEGDIVMVTEYPSESYYDFLLSLGLWKGKEAFPEVRLLSNPLSLADRNGTLIAWGKSREVASWASEHGLAFPMPPWPVVLQVNSKEFSYVNSPALPFSSLISEESELRAWLLSYKGNKVLKKALGLSGRGNLVIEMDQPIKMETLLAFCAKEWKAGRRLIAEPWVERLLDFSTQWYIKQNREIRYIGAAVIQNNHRGAYESTSVGDEKLLFGNYWHHLEQHKIEAMKILSKMAEMGYFGPAGIDAMVYQDPENPSKVCLHPIVEINARQTMSLFALQFQHRWFSNRSMVFSYLSTEGQIEDAHQIALLPQDMYHKNREKDSFSKQLYLSLNP